MNPELPQVRSVEVSPQIPGGVEFGVEIGSAQSAEQYAPRHEATPVEQSAQAVAQPVVAPPVVVQSQMQDNASSGVNNLVGDTPSLASDDDLMEKEWVDKLKKIISLTRDDPYERARVIAQLQADYLKKRYNKTLGQAGE